MKIKKNTKGKVQRDSSQVGLTIPFVFRVLGLKQFIFGSI